MPTYEYQCTACGHKLEEFQSIVAPPKRKCPNCKRRKLVRLIGSGSGVIFKGGDWPGQEIARREAKRSKTEQKANSNGKV
jgi:putative FmdB family regulatory protein